MTLGEMGTQACAEVSAVLAQALPAQAEAMAAPIIAARRIAIYGVGREGLMMKALAMRLFHMGYDVHMVGDMTTPPVEAGDLLIVSSGPGNLSTVNALLRVACDAGAATMCVTAEPTGPDPQIADHVIHLSAQTMARDQDGAASILPMGSLFEAVQLMFFEMLVLHMRAEQGIRAEDMRSNHTNLE